MSWREVPTSQEKGREMYLPPKRGGRVLSIVIDALRSFGAWFGTDEEGLALHHKDESVMVVYVEGVPDGEEEAA